MENIILRKKISECQTPLWKRAKLPSEECQEIKNKEKIR